MIELSWITSEQKTIRANFVGRWTWDDYYASIDQMRLMTKELSYPVDLIFDLQRSALISLTAPIHGDHLLRLMSGKIGTIVIVADNTYIKMLFLTFQQVYRKWSAKVMLVETIDQAHAAIHQRQV
jgi:hypothetical protein